MEHQPKTEPGLGSTDQKNLEAMSIQELVSVLRTAFLTEDFDRVEDLLVSKYNRLQTQILHLQEKFELEKLIRFQAEEDLRKREELCERGKRAQNNYETLLKEVKKTSLVDRNIIGELRKKNNELELEVCELRKLKKRSRWIDDINAFSELPNKRSKDAQDASSSDSSLRTSFAAIIGELRKKNSELELEVCELRKLKKKWVDNSNALPELPSKRWKDAQGASSSSGMAPKKPTATKKQKIGASTSGTTRAYDSTKFLGADHQSRFRDLEKRRIWSEKEFSIREHGEYGPIAGLIARRMWDKLLDPPKYLNYDLVREFYANAMPIGKQQFSFTTMVRGRQIRFDREALNAYLGNPVDLSGDQLCAYSRNLARGNWPIADISRAIFLEGRSFQLSTSGEEIRVLRDDLTTPAQVVLLLILYNLRPRSHTSSATMDFVGLLYYILAGLEIDIARVIANEMKGIAESGIRPGAKPTCVLAYPGLIMGLCIDARMTIPSQVSEVISGPINDAHIKRFCTGKRRRQPLQEPPAPQENQEHQEHQPPQAPEHPAAPPHAFPEKLTITK